MVKVAEGWSKLSTWWHPAGPQWAARWAGRASGPGADARPSRPRDRLVWAGVALVVPQPHASRPKQSRPSCKRVCPPHAPGRTEVTESPRPEVHRGDTRPHSRRCDSDTGCVAPLVAGATHVLRSDGVTSLAATRHVPRGDAVTSLVPSRPSQRWRHFPRREYRFNEGTTVQQHLATLKSGIKQIIKCISI
jgi:hypothetical protein